MSLRKITAFGQQVNGLLEEGAYVTRGEKLNPFNHLNKPLNG